MKNVSVLFTKSISPYPILDSISHACIPFIAIELFSEREIKPQIPNSICNYIITSKNASKVIENLQLEGSFYVVGTKNAAGLKQQGKNVCGVASSAKELAEKLIVFPKTHFLYFSGNLRRNELFDLLQSKHKIEEIKVYKTELHPQKIAFEYQNIVFFSPSAVKSFFLMNEISKETPIFALGNTTANEVRKYGDFILKIPKETSEKAMLELIKKEVNAKK